MSAVATITLIERIRTLYTLGRAFKFAHPSGADGSTDTPDFKRFSTYKSHYLVFI